MSLYDSFFSDLNKDHVYDLIKDIVFQNNGVNIFLNDEYRQIYDKGLEKIFEENNVGSLDEIIKSNCMKKSPCGWSPYIIIVHLYIH